MINTYGVSGVNGRRQVGTGGGSEEYDIKRVCCKEKVAS